MDSIEKDTCNDEVKRDEVKGEFVYQKMNWKTGIRSCYITESNNIGTRKKIVKII